MCKQTISEHIFLFPFAWQIKEEAHAYLFKQHKQIHGKLFNQLEGWEHEYLEIESDADYNEYVYFYKPVRAALYTKEEGPIICLNYKSRLMGQQGKLELRVGEAHYSLTVDKLNLKMYKSGVGILSINVKNYHYQEPKDIMNINSFSKSIYPSVLPIEKSFQDIYPNYIKIRLNKDSSIEEKFEMDYKRNPGRVSDVIMYILGATFTREKKDLDYHKIYIEPVIGSRMINLCLYENSGLVQDIINQEVKEQELQTFMLMSKKEGYIGKIDYMTTPYRVYGISMFSLMCISRKNVESKVYDQLVSLVLAQKASLLNFSSQIATISTLPKNELVPAIQSIYEIYIQFINQMYFDEISQDIQGSKIYRMFMEQLNIKEELKQLDFEMKEIHEYAELIGNSQSKIKMDFLTIVGAALVVPTFVTGFFGMNIMEEKFTSWWRHKEVALWFNSYVVFPILFILLFYSWNKSRHSKVLRGILSILLIINVLIIYFFGCGLTT